MSWFKRTKKENILGETGTIGLMFNPYTPKQEETIKHFDKARFIINNAELMYLRGIEDGAELNIDIAIKQLERVKQLVNIPKPTDEDVIRVMTEQVENFCNK